MSNPIALNHERSRHPIWMRAVLARTAHLNQNPVKVERIVAKQKPDNFLTGTIAARVMTDGNIWVE